MKIKDELISPYEIHFDGVQYALGIPKTDKKGVESLTGTTYYTSLSNVILKVISLKLGSEDEVIALKEYIDEHNKLVKELKESINL